MTDIKNYKIIVGIDEAGRGPIAGPVVAGAVILPEDFSNPEITDSKKLSEKKREEFYDIIVNEALAWAVGIVSPKEIDEINILKATHKAMRLAIEALSIKPDFALVDGLPVKGLPCEHEAVVKGDALVPAISCASIIAKVTRDRIMVEEDKKYPLYGFKGHKGYGTKAHIEAIKKYGVCPIHRVTFEPIFSMLNTLKLF
ncbi:MAG: ribonuclease HII [Abditibacteriota bacterium]|nr:ribonuclease HII [Abditibacteriota bacterium]